MPFADAVHHVKRVEQGRGDGRATKDPDAALFEVFEDQHAGRYVDAVRGERQRFGEPAAGIGQRHAEGPHRPVGLFG
jgi:hypothetical protein